MTLELTLVSAGVESARDVFSVRSRLMDGDEYIQFVLIAVSELQRVTVVNNPSDDDLATALLHFGAARVSDALDSGQIPTANNETAYEIRVEPGDYAQLDQILAEVPNLSNASAPLPEVHNQIRTLDPASLRLKSVSITNLMSFAGDPAPIGFESDVTVLIGPNGAGKTNLLRVFEFLRDQTVGEPAKRQVQRFVGAAAGSATKVIVKLVDDHNLTAEWTSRFDDQGALDQQTLLVGGREIGHAEHTRWNGTVRWLTSEYASGRLLSETKETVPGTSLFSVVDFSRAHENLRVVDEYLVNLRVYRYWTSSKPHNGAPADARFDAYLNPRLDNLSGVVRRILKTPEIREALYLELRQILPGFSSLEVTNPSFDQWFFVIDEKKLPADALSDGTRLYIVLALLLLDPQPSGPVILDEPEVGLHPDAIIRLGNLIVRCSVRRQVVLTTHSALLLDVIAEDHIERVRIVDRQKGSTTVDVLNAEDLSQWLDEFTLGEAWGRGAIGGNP
jgi:predicted ATPase